MELIKAAQQALEALENVRQHDKENLYGLDDDITALRTAIEQAKKQEPVAWADMDVRGEDKGLSWTPGNFHTQPLYTTPPAAQRQWVGLTDEEFHEACWESYVDPVTGERSVGSRECAVRWTEAKLREKNGGHA